MASRDRDGWQDAGSSNDFGGWSGSGRAGSLVGYKEKEGTEPDVLEDEMGGFQEPTSIPSESQELYGILVVLSGHRRMDVLRLSDRKIKLGRGHDADIHIEDMAVSRLHAVVSIRGDDETDAEFRILDGLDGLPTKSGTLVNGKHVPEGGRVLKDRDRIKVGATEMLFVQLWPGI